MRLTQGHREIQLTPKFSHVPQQLAQIAKPCSGGIRRSISLESEEMREHEPVSIRGTSTLRKRTQIFCNG